MPSNHPAFLAVCLAACLAFGLSAQADPTTHAAEETEATAADIMDTTLDGSSTAAFEAGLERVRAEATPLQSQRLDGAIEWLLIYDLAVESNREKLYLKLDGRTPNEIIAMVVRR